MLILQCDFNVLRVEPMFPLHRSGCTGDYEQSGNEWLTRWVIQLKELLRGSLGTLALVTQPLCLEEAKQPHGKATCRSSGH